MPKNEKDRPTGGIKAATLHDNTASPKDERRERGRALKAAFPYLNHAGWSVFANRPDPLGLLQTSDSGRLPELVPIRYGRMSKSPFTFFRGSASIMACDLAGSKKRMPIVPVQICGDSHALNFGAFATPERNVVFDINDFDETLPGPWEWDLKRLTTSLVLIARDNGLRESAGADAVETAVRAYREKIEEYSHLPILDIWYAKIDWENVIEDTRDKDLKKTLKEDLKKARQNTAQYKYFPKMAQEVDGRFVIKDNPPLIYHKDKDAKFVDRMKRGLELYRLSLQDDKQRLFDRYKLCDIAIKVVGIGSVGTTCAIALFLGPDNDSLFLQIKEARESVLEAYAGKSTFDNHGQRVVAGQRIIQSASDIFLGWMRLDDGRDFYVRQLRDTKVKLNTEDWTEPQLKAMARVMGAVLAKAHARSGDSATISGYLEDGDDFDSAIVDFSSGYADQVEKDHAALLAAIKSGRIRADQDA